MNKDFLLNDSKVFCMFPWVHLKATPKGDVYPCCSNDYTDPVGSTKTNTLTEIFNSDKMKELRLDMLNERPNKICDFCYKHEEAGPFSFRNYSKEQFASRFDEIVPTTQEDGTVDEFKMRYFDIRFSNICNFKCRTCGSEFSSKWGEEMKKNFDPKHPVLIHVDDNKGDVLSEVLEHIEHIDLAYFAGGEPLLSEYHWYMLSKLVENNRCKEVELRYSSNCSTLRYKDKNILDYWKQFKSVVVIASVDEVHERFNYIRWPGDWKAISKNLKKIQESFEQLGNENEMTHMLVYSPVISSLNAHRLKEILQEIIDKQAYQFSIAQDNNVLFEYFLFCNLLRNPNHLSIINMPQEHWEMVERTLDEFQNWYCNTVINESDYRIVKTEMLIEGINKVKELRKMNQQDMEFFDQPTEDYLKHMREYSNMDRVRGTDFMKTFPELGWLYK